MDKALQQVKVRRRRLRGVCFSIAFPVLLILSQTLGAGVHAQSVWERTPYRTAIILIVADNTDLPSQADVRLQNELEIQIDAHIGGAWNAVFETPPSEMRERLLGGEDRLSMDFIPEEWISQYDKLLWIVIKGGAPRYSIRAGDFDVQTQTPSPVIDARSSHPGALAIQSFRTLCLAFTPLARVEEVEEDQVGLRLRAASLIPKNSPLRDVTSGSMFQPIVRYEDREGNVRRIDQLDWTVLKVEAVRAAQLECVLYTGMRSPLSARRRGRSQQLALMMVPPERPSVITLHGFRDPFPILPGYEVYALQPGDTKATLLGRTDEQGRISVSPDPETQLRILLVKNGTRYLARLPLVPGYESMLRAPIANDDDRLAAESRLMGLQEEVIDIVTEREVLSRRVDAMIEAGREEEASKAYMQLRSLKSRDRLLMELSQERRLAVTEDDLAQRRIDAMFEETRRLVAERLNPGDIENLGAEIAEAFPSSP
jgi:hypothetical protein